MAWAGRSLACALLTPLTLLTVGLAFACGDAKPRRARTLFVLGDSYAVASAHYLLPIAESTRCDARMLNSTKNGWTAAQILDAEPSWRALLETAPKPVLVYLTIGFNDMLAPDTEKTPEATAEIVNALIDALLSEVAATGGEVVHVGYDDIWSLPNHTVFFGGEPYPLRSELSKRFDDFYAALAALRADVRDGGSYRFIDVRGWLGDRLWTHDGIHMLHENYDAQAALLWEREFREPLGCEAQKAKTPN